MAKDHYVAQTYLKRFTNTEGHLYPYRKRQKKKVGKARLPKSICYEVDGDKNPYFQNPRILDEYLPHFENNWHGKINELESGPIDLAAKYVIAGYIAFLRSCTPTAKRLGQAAVSTFLQPLVDDVATKALTNESIGLSPPSIASLKETIECGELIAEVDRNYAHALGIQSINNTLLTYYYSPWVTLINESEYEFITSDNPVIITDEDYLKPIFFVPVKPRLGLLIAPRIKADKLPKAFCDTYDNKKFDEITVIRPSKVKLLNKQMVQSSEDTVLYQSKTDWVENLVAKYSNWRVEIEIATDKGKQIRSSQRRRNKLGKTLGN